MAENSFGLKFTNTTTSKQTFKLFELGASGNDIPIESQLASNPNTYSQTAGSPKAWVNPGLTSLDYEEFPTDDLVAYAGGVPTSCVLTFSDGTTYNMASEFSAGDTLTEVMALMENRIAELLNVPSTAIGVSGRCYQCAICINDLNIIFTISYKQSTIGTTLSSIAYPNGGVVITYNFPETSTSTTGTWEIGASVTPNGVEISSQSGTSYADILESQNGSVLEIDWLDINTYSGVDDGTRQTQLLNCLKFEKRNVNGDDSIFWRCPTIDAYQFQNTLRYVGLNSKSDTYTLDGNTQFEYAIEGKSTISLDFSYSVLPNIALGNKYQFEKIVKDGKEKKKKLEEFKKYSHIKTVEFERVELKKKKFANFVTKKVKKKDNPKLVLGMVGIALLLYFFKK